MKRREFKTEDNNGEEITLYVLNPVPANYRNAKRASNRAFTDAIKDGSMLRDELYKHLRERGLWSDKKQAELENIETTIEEAEDKLQAGGIDVEEGKNIAISLRVLRYERGELLNVGSEYDSYTVEGQADNANFDSLVADCTVDETGKTIFLNINDYRDNADQQLAVDAATNLFYLINNIDDDLELRKKLPENQFLMEYGFAREDMRLVNGDGDLITSDGDIFDEDGNLEEDVKEVKSKPFTKNGKTIRKKRKKAEKTEEKEVVSE
jgi:hypothetical protein